MKRSSLWVLSALALVGFVGCEPAASEVKKTETPAASTPAAEAPAEAAPKAE